jgi:hypothetical protein
VASGAAVAAVAAAMVVVAAEAVMVVSAKLAVVVAVAVSVVVAVVVVVMVAAVTVVVVALRMWSGTSPLAPCCRIWVWRGWSGGQRGPSESPPPARTMCGKP